MNLSPCAALPQNDWVRDPCRTWGNRQDDLAALPGASGMATIIVFNKVALFPGSVAVTVTGWEAIQMAAKAGHGVGLFVPGSSRRRCD